SAPPRHRTRVVERVGRPGGRSVGTKSVLSIGTALSLLLSCGGPDVKPEDLKYMVMFDSDGAPVDPLDPLAGYFFKYEPLDDDPVQAERLFEDWACTIVDGIEESGLDKVPVFIHGGLNEQPETIQRVIDLHGE